LPNLLFLCLRRLVATGGTLQRCAKSFEYLRSQFRRQVSRGCCVLVQARAKKDATEKEKPGAATDAKMDDAPAAPEVSLKPIPLAHKRCSATPRRAVLPCTTLPPVAHRTVVRTPRRPRRVLPRT
jgi:hypothetical protein